MPQFARKSLIASAIAAAALASVCATGAGVAVAAGPGSAASSGGAVPIQLGVHQGRRYAYITINVTGGSPEIHSSAPGPDHTDRTAGSVLHVDADVTFSPERGVYKEYRTHYELSEDEAGDILVNGSPMPLNVAQKNDAGTLTRTGDHTLMLELNRGW